LVRGQISVVGRTFKLEEGRVEFLGGDKIDPLIDVKAVTQTRDHTVTIRLSGSATNIEVAMSSTPELPQDEIVSRLLFGKSTTELSGLEAVQLAAAVAEMAGGTGMGTFLDRAGGGLGIDVLRVESAGEGDETGAAVSAGEYLGDDVYVGVTQATAADSGSVEVEVELTPNISIESKVGQTGQSNLGIRFKWDY
jgi:translocation and assembly module TamB